MRASRGTVVFVAILILIMVAVLLAVLVPSYFSENPSAQELAECGEMRATTALTFTLTSNTVTQIAGVNVTEKATYTTTEQQFCT